MTINIYLILKVGTVQKLTCAMPTHVEIVFVSTMCRYLTGVDVNPHLQINVYVFLFNCKNVYAPNYKEHLKKYFNQKVFFSKKIFLYFFLYELDLVQSRRGYTS